MLEQSLLAKSKVMQSRTWLRKLKKGEWPRFLFGRIARPSPANFSLIASHFLSLPILAPVKALPGKGLEKKTLAGFGLIADGSSLSPDLELAFSKMSKVTLVEASAPCLPTWLRSDTAWKDQVVKQRGEYSARKKSAQATRESESSSTQNWPTPKALTGGANSCRTERGAGGADLQAAVKNWPTPTVCGNNNQSGMSEKAGDGLQAAARKWPTPTTHPDAPNNSLKREGGKIRARLNSQCLGDLARKWPTPAARDYKGANSALHCQEVGTGQKHMGQLANFVCHAFPQDLTISTNGAESLPSGQSSPPRFLNPAFVEWLMDFPIGWTDCDSVATPS